MKLEKPRVHKRIDVKPVWSVPCTFIAKDFRRQGISVELLKELVKYVKEKGIQIIEAYPTIPTQEKLPDAFAWIGLYKCFNQNLKSKTHNTNLNAKTFFCFLLIY